MQWVSALEDSSRRWEQIATQPSISHIRQMGSVTATDFLNVECDESISQRVYKTFPHFPNEVGGFRPGGLARQKLLQGM